MAYQPKKPRKEISQKQFETLCGIQCTLEEICAVLDVDNETLIRWCKRTYKKTFSQVYPSKKSVGKMSLRRTQFRLAERSTAMAIFLGKNYLGQSDHLAIVDNTPIEKLDGILNGIQAIAQTGNSNANSGADKSDKSDKVDKGDKEK